jgi:hypothetical protein
MRKFRRSYASNLRQPENPEGSESDV